LPGASCPEAEFARLYAVRDSLDEQGGGKCYWWNSNFAFDRFWLPIFHLLIISSEMFDTLQEQ